MLVVVSKIKAMGKKVNLRIGMDFCTKLSEVIVQIVIAAAKNAREEGMGTVKARHMPTSMDFNLEN